MIIGILVCICTGYVLLILCLSYGFWKVPVISLEKVEKFTAFSVVIPFRNEASNLPNLLTSIVSLNYPTSKVSFWFVDDASEDDSRAILENFQQKHPRFNLHIVSNNRVSNAPKKDAISTAISQIKTDWIVTTDADCIVPENWLHIFNQEINAKQPKMIAAPVTYKETNSFFNYFQLVDFLSLQGTTTGSFGLNIPFMCNGANLAYEKKAFLEVQGFSGNETIASGDDVFLLEKFLQKWSKKVSYIKSKEALVQTFAVSSWKALVSQRIRWASKSANYQLPTGKMIGILVILMNLLFCLAPLWFVYFSWEIVLVFLVSKITVDSFLLVQTLQFTQQKIQPIFLLLSSILYPYMTIFIFSSSLGTSYTWKERTFKK
jgi:cellulose synthase/poly-beta-1,6-N-acetylglucosamine synthase-like glycosyltransferase